MKKFFHSISELVKENPIFTFFVVVNFLDAVLVRLTTTGTCGVRAFFFELGTVLLFGSFGLRMKNKEQKIYYVFMTIVFLWCVVPNAIYYNFYNSFVSVSFIATSVFVADVKDAVVDIAIRPGDLLYLLVIPAIIFVVKKFKDKEENKQGFKSSLVLSLVIIGIGSALPPYYSFSRLFKFWNRVSVVNNFGVYIYQFDDIFQSLTPTINNFFGYDKALSDTKKYYEENTNTKVINEYTGIFEGKNVIAIHAESLMSFLLDMEFNGKKVAPNISKMASEGIYFNNFYAEVGVGTSSDTEFTYATGLMPSNNGTVFVNYYNNKFMTMQSLLHDKGYYVFSMHGNDGDFWNRRLMHASMGYDNFYAKDSFEIDEVYGLGLSDKSFFRQVVPKIGEIKEEMGEPFYGTLITLTNHTPWREAAEYSDFDLTQYVEVDGETVQSTYLADSIIGKYIMSVNYMDEAIGEFINDMDAAGLLENTVVIIYGDHDARAGYNQTNYLYNYDPVTGRVRTEEDPEYVEFNEYDYEIMKRVPFIIWSKDSVKNVVIDKPMGMIDVMPTLGNMLNINNKYSLGRDIMSVSKEDAIVVLNDASFITDKIYYSARNGEAYTISTGIIPDDYISTRREYVDKIIEISNNIIFYDLLKYLD